MTNAQLVQRAKEYLDLCQNNGTVPSLAHFARGMGISKKKLLRLAAMDQDVEDLKEDIETLLESTLLEKALTGVLNPAIAKLVLQSIGYSEKVDVTSKGEKVTGFNYINPHDANAEANNKTA